MKPITFDTVYNAMQNKGYEIFETDTNPYNLNIIGIRNNNRTQFVRRYHRGNVEISIKWNFNQYPATTDVFILPPLSNNTRRYRHLKRRAIPALLLPWLTPRQIQSIGTVHARYHYPRFQQRQLPRFLHRPRRLWNLWHQHPPGKPLRQNHQRKPMVRRLPGLSRFRPLCRIHFTLRKIRKTLG